jgi:hypothetical protein
MTYKLIRQRYGQLASHLEASVSRPDPERYANQGDWAGDSRVREPTSYLGSSKARALRYAKGFVHPLSPQFRRHIGKLPGLVFASGLAANDVDAVGCVDECDERYQGAGLLVVVVLGGARPGLVT